MTDRNPTIIRLHLLGIDAWRDTEGCWLWNDYFLIDTFHVDKKDLTPRKVLRMLREEGYLLEGSQGKLHVDMNDSLFDGYLIEVQTRRGEPVLALSTIH